jgi:hypothetical protein
MENEKCFVAIHRNSIRIENNVKKHCVSWRVWRIIPPAAMVPGITKAETACCESCLCTIRRNEKD